MNKKIIFDNQEGKWTATLVEYDTLPFKKVPDNTVDFIEKESFGELIQEIGMRNWIDQINKNL